ncbi:putative GPI-anchor transamidase subunit K [Monocercomonoides exilis]|uniref:putative GPI-anchor transamidase subunit K n=1 Tax=Monocercomonoides exilis TaxID=2049356 RepID=UPI00355A9A6D|nr:putative GPI-anchor transamidase subunit K [Monocercomonoides exilis]|eukprot:MONOS_8340.1-p1 / transcript=MONOS_8340.1 / gene=MONOS_8340 / organism=Monocercomonoides_exilis_PA203 / gene_product=ZYRO0D10274p / transcript_product=ZYRO0D10274p / location=Mono_scaffold00313:2500-3454(+) / protein_length=295 / sequence_SO=supercontig / SO=protein_coding / is_pseudo=false
MWFTSFIISFIIGSTFTLSSDGHNDNWAVIVDASNFFFNYRHEANALSLYHELRENGFPDDHIILMISEDFSGNVRNQIPGTIYSDRSHSCNLFDETIQVDYKGYDVNEESFMRVLVDSHPEGTARSRRMLSTENSNVLVYITGHGGENFLKFRDQSAITGDDLANTIELMHKKKRFKSLFFIADTCQASTLAEQIHTPGFFSLCCSSVGESSYATHFDPKIHTPLGDRFTMSLVEYLKRHRNNRYATIEEFYRTLNPGYLEAHPVFRTDLVNVPVKTLYLADYFSYKTQVQNIT